MKPRYSIDETGPRIQKLLDLIIAAAGFELAFSVEPGEEDDSEFENPDIVVKFTGSDVEMVLMNRGELLLALEHIVQEALRVHSDDHSRISFDANEYRAMRMQELRMSAQVAADKVKESGQPFRFNPMNSRERRIIHIALRNETDLRSESSGTGPWRCVIVYPAGMPSLPEAPPPPQRYGGGGGSAFNRDREKDRERDRMPRRGERRGGPGGPRGGDRRGPRGPRH